MTTIPISRDAVEQALQGADKVDELLASGAHKEAHAVVCTVGSTLRAALAQADQPAVPQTQAVEPSPIAYGFESRGKIMDVITPEEHDREPGRYNVPLITLQSHREAIKVIHDDWELDVRQHREVIAKKDAEIAALELEAKTGAEFYVAERDKKDAEAAELRAALVGCVGVLENARGCLQAAQAEGLEERLMEDTTDTRLKDLVERRLLHAFYPLDAAITQAQGVLG